MSDNENPRLTIGRLAKKYGVNVETVRYYQRRGLLLTPERPPGGVRRYGASDQERLAFVQAAKQLGFSLDEIGDLLTLEDGTHCQEARMIAERKLENVRGKLRRLQQIEKALSETVAECNAEADAVTCPLILSLRAAH